MRVSSFLVIALGSLGLSAACSPIEPEREEVVTFYVASETVECSGPFPQRCLLVRSSPDADWTYFYDAIEGFTHEEGYLYRLRVSRREIPDPPQDSGAFEYRLIRILSRIPS